MKANWRSSDATAEIVQCRAVSVRLLLLFKSYARYKQAHKWKIQASTCYSPFSVPVQTDSLFPRLSFWHFYVRILLFVVLFLCNCILPCDDKKSSGRLYRLPVPLLCRPSEGKIKTWVGLLLIIEGLCSSVIMCSRATSFFQSTANCCSLYRRSDE